MLRFIVFLLLLANGAYFAWSQGHLALFGLTPLHQSEPVRMQTQIKPEAMRVLGSTEARRMDVVSTAPASPPASRSAECLQSSLLDNRTAEAVRQAGAALPEGSWSLIADQLPARWIVYMGKYTNPDTLAKKKAELRQFGVRYEELQNTSLEPGISLGGYNSQAEANAELTELSKRGVRTAKVVQEKAVVKGQMLRLPAVDDTLRPQIEPLKTALGSATLRACTS